MKKLLLFVLLASVTLGCRKDDDDEDNTSTTTTQDTYSTRLVGGWDLDGVDYEFEIPSIIPGAPPTKIDGAAENVVGDFTITHNPNRVTWNYSFDVAVTGIGNIPVNQSNTGTWTLSSDEKTIYLELDDQTSSRMDVLSNELNTQVFSTVVTENVQIIGDIDVDTEITLIRQL